MQVISCDRLDEAIGRYNSRGYRLDMIFPADAPREALMSCGDEEIRLISSDKGGSATAERGWTTGRAGMMYRDLIPGNIDGKVIASHIRLAQGGPVADYVHYHKIDFQMIYCLKGRILVVYEDQGPPFWLETGDCIVQPPGIRHRVLECTAGAEVLEITSPAEHETWVDHEMTLPNERVDREREFAGQRFVLTRASEEV